MKRKTMVGFTLTVCLVVFSFLVMALADTSDETPIGLQEGDDSPGVHQCPRDGYDSHKGPANRNGFGYDF